ncbi:MAG: carboxypeptidase-like regulatory domain-containing protein [Bacteroidales bacterium]
MNKLQETRLSMYLAVRDFLLQNGEITKDLPNYEANFKDLQKTIEEIQSIAEVQKSDIKGYAKNKLLLKEKLMTLVLASSYKLNAFATFSGDVKLQAEVKITRSKLSKAPDTGLRDYAQIIHDKAESNIDALTSYGITKETQSEISDYISRYNAALSGPRVAKTETVKATKQMASLFEHAESLLNAVTIAIGIIRIAQPIFIKGFETAKKAVISGTTTLALRATAVDSKSGAAVKGAKFIFRSENVNLAEGEPAEIVKKTAKKGMFKIRNIRQGTYTVTISKPGYKEKVVSVVVNDGEMTEMKVEMEAA